MVVNQYFTAIRRVPSEDAPAGMVADDEDLHLVLSNEIGNGLRDISAMNKQYLSFNLGQVSG
jgi:hypothetical protein